MARNVTLLQLRTDIAALADYALDQGRFPAATVNRRINESRQRFCEELSAEGVQHFLTHATGTLTAGATSPHAFGLLDLSAATPSVVRVFKVTIKVNGETVTVPQVDLMDTDGFGGPTSTGVPSGWSNYGTRGVALFPPPGQAYPYVVYYLPVLADLSADGDTWDGVAGWEEWVTWDVVAQLLVRDNYAQQYAIAVQARDSVQARVMRAATRVTSAGGAHVARDSFGASIAGRGRRPRLPPPA